MARDHAALLEVLEAMKSAGVDERIKLAATTIYQALIDAELTSVIGAGPWEHHPDRTAHRNGYRARLLSTPAGDLELSIPKLRSGVGSFFPSLLERRRRVDQALFAVVMEAYLHGVSTRKVDDLVKALGIDSGISKSEVSRICADLDVEVSAFRDRSLAESAYPYVFLDATYCKARVNHRVVSQAVVIATGSPATAAARSSASTSATPKTARFGPRSCAASKPEGWAGCSWSSPTPTPDSNRPSAR
jgi:putative transposase